MVKVNKCPHCGEEISLSGLRMHIKNKHTDKVATTNWDEIKQTAYNNGVKRGTKKPKTEDKIVDTLVETIKEEPAMTIEEFIDEPVKEEKVDEPVKESPKKEESFLTKIWDFINSAKF